MEDKGQRLVVLAFVVLGGFLLLPGSSERPSSKPADGKPTETTSSSDADSARLSGFRRTVREFFAADPLDPGLPDLGDLASRAGYDLEFLVAILPDPIDSQMGTQFDSFLAAIRQAAEASEFVLDRFDLPWTDARTAATSGPNLRHRTTPGVVLFRGGGDKLLVLLLVGETPTTGVHKTAFVQALRAAASAPGPQEVIRVLGPTFSGSITSLRLALCQWFGSGDYGTTVVRFLSGSATRFENKQDLERPCKEGLRVTFHATVHPDSSALRRLLAELVQPGECGGLAMLVESNTAYGESLKNERGNDQWPCKRPYGVITYPAHISSLRTAYDAEGRIGKSTDDLPGFRSRDPLRPAFGEGRERLDLLPTMSPRSTARSVEQELQRLLGSFGRRYRGHVGLLATNVRDKVFLAQELYTRFPDVRFFTLESDLLLAHADFRPYLLGSVVVSTYPLDGRMQGTAFPRQKNRKLQFSSSGAQGVYNAMVLHLSGAEMQGGAFVEPPGEDWANRLVDYGGPCEGEPGKDGPETEPATARVAGTDAAGTGSSAFIHRPALWKSVIGRNGFWPLRILDDDATGLSLAECQEPGMDPGGSPRDVEGSSAAPAGAAGKEEVRKRIACQELSYLAGVRVDDPDDRSRPASCLSPENLNRNKSRIALVAGRLPFFVQILTLVLVVSAAPPLRSLLRRLRERRGASGGATRAPGRLDVSISGWCVLLVLQLWVLQLFRHPLIFWFQGDVGQADRVAVASLAIVITLTAIALAVAARRKMIEAGARSLRIGEIASGTILAGLGALAAILLMVAFSPSEESDARMFVRRATAFASGVSPLLPVGFFLMTAYLYTLSQAWRNRLLTAYDLRTELTEIGTLSVGEMGPVGRKMGSALQRLPPFTTVVFVTLAMIPFMLPLIRIRNPMTIDGRSFQGFFLSGTALLVLFIGVTLLGTLRLWHALKDFLGRMEHHPFIRVYDAPPARVAAKMAQRIATPVPRLFELADGIERLRLLKFGYDRWEGGLLFRIDSKKLRSRLKKELDAAEDLNDEFQAEIGRLPRPGKEIDLAGSPSYGRLRRAASVVFEVLVVALRHPRAPGTVLGSGERRNSIAWVARSEDEWLSQAGNLAAVFPANVVRHALAHIRNKLSFACAGSLLLLGGMVSYPFQPRRLFVTAAGTLILAAVGVAIYVLAGVERNNVISRMADTKPGVITWDRTFLGLIAALVGLPLLALVGTQFPSLSSDLAGLLAPFLRAFG